MNSMKDIVERSEDLKVLLKEWNYNEEEPWPGSYISAAWSILDLCTGHISNPSERGFQIANINWCLDNLAKT